LREIIEQRHEVVDFWIGEVGHEQSIDLKKINDGDYDIVIFFQLIFDPKQIKKIKCKNIIWIR
jgi:hypothetical protein